MQIVHDIQSRHYSSKICYHTETIIVPSIHIKTKHGYNDKTILWHYKEDSSKRDFVKLTENDIQELKNRFVR